MFNPGVSHLPLTWPSALPTAEEVEPSVGTDAVDRSASEPDARWDLLVACLAGYILTAVGRLHQLFPILEILHPAIITGLAAIVLYAMDRRDDRRLNVLQAGATRCLLGLVTWMALSTPGSIWLGNSLDLLANNFVKTTAMYFVMAGAVRGARDVERLAAAYLVGAAMYAGVVIFRFDLGAGDAWRLGHLYYYDANDFAAFAVSAMPFGLYFAHASDRRIVRVLAVVALAALAVAFVRTGSRGGFVALVAIAGFVVFRYTTIPLRWRVMAPACLAVIFLSVASDEYWQQMGTILSDTDYNHTQESGRLQIWQRGMGYMLQHPIFGVGPNNFGMAEGTLSPFAERQQFGVGVRWNAAHNSFVQVGAELGIPGLVLFVGLIAGVFVSLYRSSSTGGTRRCPRPVRPELTQALTASMIGFVVGAFFLSLAYSEMLYTLAALAVGLSRVAGATERPARMRSWRPLESCAAER